MAPFAWPDGHRAALSLTFDVDAESAILAVDPSYAGRLSTMSHQRYGPSVGVPRILRMLERTGVRATFFVPGLTADLHPAMVEASILDAVAPPEATQLLDSAFVATAGRAIVQQIVADCRTDSFCATQYQDLTGAVASLLSATSIRKTVIAPGTGDWRTLEVSGPTILSVLGISSGSDVSCDRKSIFTTTRKKPSRP